MKKIMIISSLIMVMTAAATVTYADFGDFRSETLVSKAWKALQEEDIEGVMMYVDKCLELYGPQAQKMQASLEDFPMGANDEIFSYWALNDVSTILFIKAEMLRKSEMADEAKKAYFEVINDYPYGQAWDQDKKMFWKPVNAAKEKLVLMESGLDIEFGDYSSSFLTTQAWRALGKNDLELVNIYTQKVIELYGDQAKKMQASIDEMPIGSQDDIHASFWALNDVGTSYFIKGKAHLQENKVEEAKDAFTTLIDQYAFAQCWDPKGGGFFWPPAKAAQEELDSL